MLQKHFHGLGISIKLFEPVNEESNAKFLVPVDLIRVVGIYLVIFLHVTNTFYNQIYQGPISAGSWWTYTIYKSIALPSVPLFVILTGALLLQPSKTNEPIKVFFKKRLNRIGLAFLFWTAVYLAWSFYVTQTPVTFFNIVQGSMMSLFTGSYYHFWYLYLIAGLYLITPFLRAVIAFKNPQLIKYLILLWFVGISIVPLLPLFTIYSINGELFLFGGYIGYFLLGSYLQKDRLQRPFMYGFLVLGLVLTVAGTWVMTYPLEALNNVYFFFDYLAISVVIMSVALYAFLNSFKADWPSKNHPHIGKLVQTISRNTLPIFLFHVIVLEVFSRGLLGFTLDLSIIPIVEIPLAAAAILMITLGLVLLVKKVPILKKLIG